MVSRRQGGPEISVNENNDLNRHVACPVINLRARCATLSESWAAPTTIGEDSEVLVLELTRPKEAVLAGFRRTPMRTPSVCTTTFGHLSHGFEAPLPNPRTPLTDIGCHSTTGCAMTYDSLDSISSNTTDRFEDE